MSMTSIAELLIGLLYVYVLPALIVLTAITENKYRNTTKALYAAYVVAYSLLLPAQYLVYNKVFNLSGGIRVGVDSLSFAFTLSGLFIVLYLWNTKHTVPPGGKYLVFALLTTYLASLISLTRSWLVFIILWEALSYMAYMLITSTTRKRIITYSYYGTMHLTGLLMILGAALLAENGVWNIGSKIDMSLALPVILLATGMLAKTGLIPFHYWVQTIYDNVEPVVAGAFSALIDPVGILGLFRLASSLTGSLHYYYVWTLIILGSISAIIASIWMWGSERITSFLAWSTIYNIGWMTLLLAFPIPSIVLATYILAHGLAKVTGFTSISGITSIEHLRTDLPGRAAVFAASLLGIEAIPPFTLFFIRLYVLTASISLSPVTGFLIVSSWIIAGTYMFKLLLKTLFPSEKTASTSTGLDDLGGPMYILMGIALIVSLLSLPIILFIGGAL